MTWYGQNQEDRVVDEYFGDKVGNLLSIGENDGITLSNCRALLEKGWNGILVEPSSAYINLLDLYYDEYSKIWCYNVAIGNQDGEVEFYESGEHLGRGDVALLSTVNEKELIRWKNSPNTFSKTKVRMWTFETLQKEVVRMNYSPTYDFINIDAEGMDLEILQQIDLNEVECQCLCIEHNSVLSTLQEIKDYCAFYGLKKELAQNSENIILAR